MWSRGELKARAKEAMRRNRGACIGVALLMGVISAGVSVSSNGVSTYSELYGTSVEMTSEAMATMGILAIVAAAIALIGGLLTIFVQNILTVGGCGFFVKNQYGAQPRFDAIFDGFRSGCYGNIFSTMFIMQIKIALWSLLFIIPGIIKSYEYMMVPYILSENPGMDRTMAFKISKRMMDGQKMDAFVLDLSFFGWQLANAVTFGILGLFFVNPYIQATKAELYAYSKQRAFEEGYIR